MIWVRNISGGYELTDRIEGLGWSSVNPGGDESATFTFRGDWTTALPEIARGDTIHIGDGLDVLWQGRIEEHDRGGTDTPTVGVTAYGLGARLKDGTFTEIFRDADMTAWTGTARTRRPRWR
jgi:hypothetical protein